MKLKDRSQAILKTSVSDFISAGKPITSDRLFKNYDFGIKSAMIRWELHDLGKEGFFCQRHPSGGRVPSDKAYRFFVNSILKSLETKKELERWLISEISSFMSFLERNEKKQFTKKLAYDLKALSVYYDPALGELHESGFNDLLENLDTLTKDDIVDIAEDFEFIPERLSQENGRWSLETKWPQVFIGKNPITRSRHLSVIMHKVSSRGKTSFLIIAIGPKRMDYEKSLKIFKHLNQTLNSVK